MPVTNILICALLVAGFSALLLPVEKVMHKFLNLTVGRFTAPFILLFAAVGIEIYIAGLIGVLYLALSAFCLWVFVSGFLSDRRYLYTLAIVFLVLSPILLIANLDRLAELTAILCYLCLILGVLKDIFHSKFIHGGGNG